MRLDRKALGNETQRLTNSQTLRFSRQREVTSRIRRPQDDRLGFEHHRHGLSPPVFSKQEPAGPLLSKLDHGLIAAVFEGPLLELATFAAHDRAVERCLHGRGRLGWTRSGNGWKRLLRRLFIWYLRWELGRGRRRRLWRLCLLWPVRGRLAGSGRGLSGAPLIGLMRGCEIRLLDPDVGEEHRHHQNDGQDDSLLHRLGAPRPRRGRRVESPWMKGMAAEHAARCQPTASRRTMRDHSLACIVRARRRKSAVTPEDRREHEAVAVERRQRHSPRPPQVFVLTPGIPPSASRNGAARPANSPSSAPRLAMTITATRLGTAARATR